MADDWTYSTQPAPNTSVPVASPKNDGWSYSSNGQEPGISVQKSTYVEPRGIQSEQIPGVTPPKRKGLAPDEEVYFDYEKPETIQVKRLTPAEEGLVASYIQSQAGKKDFSYEKYRDWFRANVQTPGLEPVNDPAFIKSVQSGTGFTSAVDYGNVDQQALEADKAERDAMKDAFGETVDKDQSVFGREYQESVQYGFPGLIGRWGNDFFDTGKEELRKAYPGQSDEWYEQKSDELIRKTQRAIRDYYAEASDKDPVWKDRPGLNMQQRLVANAPRVFAGLLGNLGGSVGPESLMLPGSSVAGRVGGQVAIGGASELGYELADVAEGVSDKVHPENIAAAATLGGLFQTSVEGLGGLLRSGRTGDAEYSRAVQNALDTGASRAEIDAISAQYGKEPFGPELDEVLPPRAAPEAQPRGVEGEEGLPGPMAMEGEAGIQGPRYTPKPEGPPKITADAVVERVNKIAKDWKNSPAVEVVNSVDDIVDPVIKGSIDDPTNTLGFLGEDGKVRIIAGNLKSEAEIPAILFHEALGHHGLAQKFGDDLDGLLTRMYESGGKFKNAVDEFLDSRPDYASAYADDPNPKARIVEEILAGRSESGIAVPPNILAKAKHYLKELGRKMGLNIEFNDLEVRTILGMAHDATINGKPTAASNGFRYSMEGQKFTKDTVIDDRFKREDTLLRREVKKKNTEKSYEDWQRDWEFDNFIDELEAQRPIGTTEQFEDLSGRGREGPVVQTYTNEELMQRLANGGPRYMKRPSTEASEASRSGDRIRLTTKNVKRGTPPGNAAKTFLRELGIYNNLELMEMSMSEAIERASRLGVDRDWLDYFNDAKWNPETKNIDTPTPQPDMSRYLPKVKYMKREAGPGSEGMSTDMSRRAADEAGSPYTGMGKVRSNRPDVTTILEEAAPTRDQQSWDEWIDASKQVRKSAEKHSKDLKKGIGSEPADIIAARVGALNLANRISDLSKKIGQGMGTEHDKYTLAQEMVKLAALEDAIAGVVGNAARIQNSMKIEIASDTATNRAIRYMSKNLGSLEDVDGIARRINEFQDNPEAVQQLAKDALKPLPEDYITSFRYTAMLSGLGTPVKAVVGTMSNMLFENTKDAVAVGLGALKRPFTDSERLTAREWGARNVAMVKSIIEATKAAGKSYVAGQAVNAPDRLDIGHVSLPVSIVTEYPKRTLAAIDGFFREIIRGGEINGLAVRQALKEGLEPESPEWNARIDELITNPTKEMEDIATKKADLQQLLDNDSRILKGMETLTRRTTDMNAVDRTIRFAVQNIFPFTRNIDNIMRQTLRNSPIGFFSKNVQADLKAGGARRDQALARIIVGSTLLYFAGEYAANGLATGQGNTNLDMEALNAAAGRPANSVKIGDEWVSLEGFDAISAPFNAAASARIAWDKGEIDDKTYLTRMLKATGAIASSLYDTTIIEQMDKFTGLFDKRNQNTELAVSLPASFVPAAVRQYTQWGEDRASLDTRGDKSFGDRVVGRTLSGLPEGIRTWIAEKLDFGEMPQKMDVFGRGVRREGDPLAAATGIGRGTVEDMDPGVQEVLRLSEKFGKALVTKTEDEFTVDGEKIKLSPTERQQWQYLAGQLILEEINGALKDPVWPTLSDEEKADEIKLIVKDSKKDVKDEIFAKYLEPEEEEGVDDGFIYE